MHKFLEYLLSQQIYRMKESRLFQKGILKTCTALICLLSLIFALQGSDLNASQINENTQQSAHHDLVNFWNADFFDSSSKIYEIKIEILFKGNDSFSEAAIMELCKPEITKLKQSARHSSDFNYVIVKKHYIDDAAFKINKFYKLNGFNFADVNYQLIYMKSGIQVIFFVTENNRIELTQINFIGNTAFSSEFLRQYIDSGTADYPGVNKSSFIQNQIEKGILEIKKLYVDSGYLDFEIVSQTLQYTPEPPKSSEAELTLIFNEGKKYSITSFELTCSLKGLEKELVKILKNFIGIPFNDDNRSIITASVIEFFKRRGFWGVKLKVSYKNEPDKGHVIPILRIDAGGKYIIDKIYLNKSKSINKNFLKSLLTFQEGDFYDVEEERESFRRLVRSNLLKDVKIYHFPSEEEKKLNCFVGFTEKWTGELKAVVGWGSYEKLRGYLQLSDNNIFDLGRRVALKFGGSQVSEYMEAEYKDPWTLGLPETTLSLEVYYRKRTEPFFTLQEFGTKLSIEYLLTSDVTLSMEYEIKDSRAFNITDPGILLPSEINAVLGTLSGYFLFDNRDSIMTPTEGMRQLTRVEWYSQVLGGSTSFMKFSFTGSFYANIGRVRKVVLAFRYLTAFYVPIGDTEQIPIQERMYNGGEVSVRSFFEQGMKAGDNTNAKGGQVKNVISAELRFPLIWNWGVDGAIFIDAGNLASKIENYLKFWHVCFGFGLRYLTPFASVRLDVAYDLNLLNNLDNWAYHISIGFPF